MGLVEEVSGLEGETTACDAGKGFEEVTDPKDLKGEPQCNRMAAWGGMG